MGELFRRAEILLPEEDIDMTKWSVVACDQFSAQPAYWEARKQEIGDKPSALHMMLPEAYLADSDPTAAARRIDRAMEEYLELGVFRTLPDSYVYVERTLQSGIVRRGLVGVLDLEEYDYSKDSVSPIRATEGTIESRLPVRVQVREGAALEMPHVMVFIDDPENTVMGQLSDNKHLLPELYDFDLNGDGGHLLGRRVSGKAADRIDTAIAALGAPETLRRKYGAGAPVVFAMGDGNHSLATAKQCWERMKPRLTAAEKKNHPARWSLVELVNIHDEAITFEPIHRVLFGTDPEAFLRAAEDRFERDFHPGAGLHRVLLVTEADEREVTATGFSIGTLIGMAEEFCQDYIAAHGGSVDYIHNDETAIELGRKAGCAALLLPKMEKNELFPSIVRSGPFPKKSFSIGRAGDKRYYMECRKIK